VVRVSRSRHEDVKRNRVSFKTMGIHHGDCFDVFPCRLSEKHCRRISSKRTSRYNDASYAREHAGASMELMHASRNYPATIPPPPLSLSLSLFIHKCRHALCTSWRTRYPRRRCGRTAGQVRRKFERASRKRRGGRERERESARERVPVLLVSEGDNCERDKRTRRLEEGVAGRRSVLMPC